jgi:hypothetical protein
MSKAIPDDWQAAAAATPPRRKRPSPNASPEKPQTDRGSLDLPDQDGDALALAREALSAGVAMDAAEDDDAQNPHGLASPTADRLTDGPADGPADDLTDQDGNRLMSAAEFGAHAGDLLGMLSGVTGLKSLAIPPDMEGRAGPAWGVVHTYLQKWAPSVLRPVDGWISDAFVVGMFVVPWGQAVVAEVKEKRAEKADRLAALGKSEPAQTVKMSGGTVRPGESAVRPGPADFAGKTVRPGESAVRPGPADFAGTGLPDLSAET